MRLLTPDRDARLTVGRRRALKSLGGVALVGLTRKSLGGIGAIGRAVGSIGAGLPGPSFAPNYNSVSSGTQMTSPVFFDRQFTTADRTAANALNGTADSYSWTWFAGDYSQPPIIDTAANIATAIGATVAGPPDGNSTIMAVEWLSGKPIGQAPWNCQPPSGKPATPAKFYLSYYVYIPSTFTANGCQIKWCQLTHSKANNSTNDIIGVVGSTGWTPADVGPHLYQQGDVHNGTPYGSTSMLTAGAWHCIEYYAQIESPWGSTNGVLYIWVDGVKVYSSTSMQYVQAYPVSSISNASAAAVVLAAASNFVSTDYIAFQGVGGMTQINSAGQNLIASYTDNQHFTLNLDTSAYGAYTSGGLATRMGTGYFNQGGIIPYYGGGGSPAPANEYVCVGRWFEAFANS